MTCGIRANTAFHGGNIQVLADLTGFPIWVSGVEPGSTHDINAARRQGVTGALYAAASTSSLVTLADKGYEGAGIGIETPTKGHNLHPDTACRNQLLSAMRAPAEPDLHRSTDLTSIF